VHRPHTIIGFAVGNAMNMGVTLAMYAMLCKASGQPFVFSGSPAQWNSLTDMTDARLLARHLAWASTNEGDRNEDFNVVNGDVFRWKWRWPRLADRMADAPAQWAAIAAKHQLREPDIDRLASWWQAGFLDFQGTPDAFVDLFQRLEAERIIPKR
jgi:hypothetical protein